MLIINSVKVGDGITKCLWSDRHAYTVIKISASGKKLTIQRDNVKRITEPKFIEGGFMGICINNNDIEYEYSPNPGGNIEHVYATRDGKFKNMISGRHEKYDYNF